MALQTSVLRDGQWVTETVNFGTVIRANSQQTANSQPAGSGFTVSQAAISKAEKSSAVKSLRQRLAEPLRCGVLTQTIVQSPISHWILPARLRSPRYMDVAFIGDHYIQVSELGKDGRLRHVLRKTDFGSRIRNAKVVGRPLDRDRVGNRFFTDGDDDLEFNIDTASTSPSSTGSVSQPPQLPPQQLLIVLETGDCVFLFLRRGPTGKYVFEFSRVTFPGRDIANPGFHTAIDPSSRYLAMACPENFFIVYELDTHESMDTKYRLGQNIHPVRTYKARPVNGVIHKMEFLYPHPDDDYHVILLMIIVRNGKTSMVIYEWEIDENMEASLSEEKWGQQLPPQHRLPLLIIPLTVHSAFFVISANRIAVCRDALHRPAEFADFLMDGHESSPYYYGTGHPLWTAWTRPYRLPTYQTTRDNIYLAREDGVVMFLEIDSDNILGASVQIGKFDCSIGTSFCSLLDAFNDILIMGGDSGPGTICQIRPRKPNIKIGDIPNWSPVLDFVSSDKYPSAEQVLAAVEDEKVTPWQMRKPGQFSPPDRIFATSGRGVTGCITEIRYGYRANIALDLDPHLEVKVAWIFWTDSDGEDVGFHLLLSLVDRSVGLHLTPDLDRISEPATEKLLYDLSSRTITALQRPKGDIIHVTEKSLVYIRQHQSRKCRLHTDIFQNDNVIASNASIDGSWIALSTNTNNSFQVHLLGVGVTGDFSLIRSFDQATEITCLHMATLRDSPYIAAGLLEAGKPSLFLCKADEETAMSWTVDLNSDEETKLRSRRRKDGLLYSPLEPLTSVCVLREGDEDNVGVSLGTRGGEMGVVVLGPAGKVTAIHSLKLGTGAVYLSSMESESFPQGAVLALCDGRIHQMSGLEAWRATFETVHLVWLEDVSDSRKPPPFASSLTMLHGALPGKRQECTQFVFTSHERVLAAELHDLPGPVHRSFPVAGTPTIVLYSHVLECLVVALKTLDGKPTVQFMDPDTGEDLSVATDKFNEPVPFAAGLGREGDQILGLNEWQYERNADTWIFVLAGTREGRMLVLSMTPATRDRYGRREKIRYWTRYRRSPGSLPVTSVMGLDRDVFYCMGTTIYWDRLNLEERRLDTQGSFELASIATSLRMVNGFLVALTDRDSMEIIKIDSGRPGDMTLHHGDMRSHHAAHMIEIGDQSTDASGMLMSGVLLADRNSGLSGAFVPWQRSGADCTVMFEGDLSGSVRRFVRGRMRPIWQQAEREVMYGLIPSTPDGVDILGMCIDGSLLHFTFLSMGIWRVFRLVQNLSFVTPVLYPFGYELPGPAFNGEPAVDGSYGMQIDGDMLKRCLKKRALEGLFDRRSRIDLLIHYLDELDGGRWTADIRGEDCSMSEEEEIKMYKEKRTRYLALTYEILEYYVASVM